MDPNITAMLEQMRSQQQQQQQQHEAMMQRLVEQQAAQTPIGSREQKPGDPAARVEGSSELIPKFISCAQFNGTPENWEDPVQVQASHSLSVGNCSRGNDQSGRLGDSGERRRH